MRCSNSRRCTLLVYKRFRTATVVEESEKKAMDLLARTGPKAVRANSTTFNSLNVICYPATVLSQ